MRILFSSYAYPNAGQPELATFNRTMLAALARSCAVRVVAPVPFLQRWSKPPRPDSYAAIPGIEATYPTFYYPPKFGRDRYDRWLWWSVRATLKRTIAEFRPDVVLSYWAHPDGTVAVRAAHEAGLPAVVMVGGSDVLILGRSGARRKVILETLHAADAVIAVSGEIAQVLREDGLDSAKIAVVPRGVDDAVFHPGDQAAARARLGLPTDRHILLGVGRLVDVKDWPTWIEACREVHRQGVPIASYVLGGGSLSDELRRRIATAGLTDIVTLHGPQSQHTLAEWYRAADLTVLSSRSEGVPNVLLETLASGGSFVATAVGGIPEIADTVHDRLVPPGDPQALAAAIIDRLTHTPPAGCPRRFEPRTAHQAAGQLLDVLQAVRTGDGTRTANQITPRDARVGI
jgi:teichuronic acid biosynthesis glycosyltransferase TuaC